MAAKNHRSVLFHPWHHITAGDQSPAIVNAIIEIPQGSKAKYELDKPSGLLRLDRVLFSAVHYPANYGFIPSTYFTDNDPLDILVFASLAFTPMCIVAARVIGLMHMVDGYDTDDKIIAVAHNDMAYHHVKDIDQLPEYALAELRNFFEDYKKLENKKVTVGEFKGLRDAYNCILESEMRYKQKFSST
jgi:inorganic pyrophosphatase